ncbi:angiopoietin-related protein 6 isoform X2 [Megalops cyprinoides]|uniref:angiopoietin-related protein 6 isoform X2 n=1 Tax=Megalops cyprinoides TaxID=118141 RepID=UPI001863F304|nr:angiopoietin-related protein 6 isoform X2 [Megalops cyprinoides]
MALRHAAAALALLVLLAARPGPGRAEPDRAGRRGAGSQKRQSRASEARPGRCSYTFIVPQQRLQGALCVSTAAGGADMGGANRSEAAALRQELRQQQQQLEQLRGGLDAQLQELRRDSSSMNARITQLYTQLLHGVINKKDQALEQQRLETLLLNTSTQVLQLSARYTELEQKYEVLSSLVHNQSVQLTHSTPVQQPAEPQSDSMEPVEEVSDIQRDQSPALPQRDPPTTTHSPPTDHPFISYPVTKTPGPWRDCQHALESGERTSGIYLLRPRNANRLLQAWCEAGWTVIQRRQDGSVNFFRTWDQYKGFGNLDGEYWLGLEHLYWLTAQAQYRLRVALEDWQGRQVFAEYDSFHLEPESDWYRLRLGRYHGNAGDSLSWHNNKAFTTLDRDKDAYTGNCAHYQKGGWWYHMCAHSNLNGVWYRGGHYRSRYQDGVYWAEFHGGSYSLKRAAMMIKPI